MPQCQQKHASTRSLLLPLPHVSVSVPTKGQTHCSDVTDLGLGPLFLCHGFGLSIPARSRQTTDSYDTRKQYAFAHTASTNAVHLKLSDRVCIRPSNVGRHDQRNNAAVPTCCNGRCRIQQQKEIRAWCVCAWCVCVCARARLCVFVGIGGGAIIACNSVLFI
jgi:hypothetical protein